MKAQRSNPVAMRQNSGFTLIEVLVALSIVSITLIAALQASAALTRNAERKSQLMLAQVCADNAINALRLGRVFPDTGIRNQTCEQAGQTFDMQMEVSRTRNPNFNLVAIRVMRADTSVLQLLTAIGRY